MKNSVNITESDKYMQQSDIDRFNLKSFQSMNQVDVEGDYNQVPDLRYSDGDEDRNESGTTLDNE